MTATERRAPSCAPPCTLTPTSRTDQGEAEPAQADSAGYRTQDPGRPAPVSLESWSDRMPTASALIPVILAAGLPPALRVEITSPKTRLSVFEPVKLTARVTANKTVTVPPMSDTPRDWRTATRTLSRQWSVRRLRPRPRHGRRGLRDRRPPIRGAVRAQGHEQQRPHLHDQVLGRGCLGEQGHGHDHGDGAARPGQEIVRPSRVRRTSSREAGLGAFL